MAVGKITCLPFVLFNMLVVGSYSFLLPKEDVCPVEALVDFTTEIEKAGEPLTINRTLYPPDAIQTHGNRIYGCPCKTRACLPFCCPPRHHSYLGKCVPLTVKKNVRLPLLYDSKTFTLKEYDANEFHIFSWDPCHGGQKYMLEPDAFENDKFLFLSNGSIYLPADNLIYGFSDYCFGVMDQDVYNVVLCFESNDYVNNSVDFHSPKTLYPVVIYFFGKFTLGDNWEMEMQ